MADFHPIITNFTAGEFSPAVYGRVDIQRYPNGAKKIENFMLQPQGGIVRRSGTMFSDEAKDSSKKTRVVNFEFSTEQAYVIEFGDLYVRFYKDEGQITSIKNITGTASGSGGKVRITSVGHGFSTGNTVTIAGVGGTTEANGTWIITKIDADNFDLTGTTYVHAYTSGGTATAIVEISTPYTEDEIFDISFTQSADILYICHENHWPRKLSRTSHTEWTLTEVAKKDGPYLDMNEDEAVSITASALTGTGISLTSTGTPFTADHVGSIWRLEESSASKNNEWEADVSYSAGDRVIYKGIIYEADNSATSGDRPPIHEKGTESDGGVDWIYLHQGYGVVEIKTFVDTDEVTADVVSTLPNSATSGTIRWREGAWSAERGYPRCVCFFEERLVFAGTPHQPQTTWMSRSGDYEVFSPTVQDGKVLDTTAITYTIASNKVNAIQWMSSGSVLVFGTAGEEWQAFSGKPSEPMTPSNIQVKPQTSFGSDNVRVSKIGSAWLFVQRSGRKLRELIYNYEIDSFVAKDMTLLADHIMRDGDYIVDAAYQQEPFSIWWGVRADGQLCALTYLRDQEVVGWTRHIIAGENAKVESVCTIPNPEGNADQVWMVVNRTINGSTKRYIEVLEDVFYPDDDQDKNEMHFLDSFLTFEQTAKPITGATKASPIVITCSAHGYNNGDFIKIEGVEGMTELNGKWFKVANKNTNDFELVATDNSPIDGTGYTTYVSGGNAYKGVTTITGLSHLEGETVGVCADGAVRPDQTVSSGSITLDNRCIRATVGLKYLSIVTTIRPEGGVQLGTAQGKVKRVNKVDVRLQNSLGLKYGALDDYSEDLPFRLPEHPMDQSPPFFTGDKELQLDDSYTRDGYLTIATDYPYPLNITAIMPQLEIYEQR